MACDLTRSRGRICKESLGGNSILYLYDYLPDSFTLAAGEAEASGMNVALTANYSYALEGDGNTLSEAMVPSLNGTRVNTQTLTVTLPKMSAADAAEFNLLAASSAMAVIQDRNGDMRVLGITEGMLWSITGDTGGAKTDANQYTIVGTAQEALFAPTLDSATKTAFLAVTVAVV